MYLMNAPKIDHCTETDNFIKEIINLYLFIFDRIPPQLGNIASKGSGGQSLHIPLCVGAGYVLPPLQGNSVLLEVLLSQLREYKAEVASGRLPVYIDGYCIGLPSPTQENLQMAAVRSNHVKSELIHRTETSAALMRMPKYNARLPGKATE